MAVYQVPDNIAAITGPRFIGELLHWGLFGVLVNQVYLYTLAFPNDPLRTKVIVYVVFALEIAQTMMITKSAFAIYAAGFGNMDAADNVQLVWLCIPLTTGLVGFITQGFYAYRISVLAQSYWVSGVVSLLAIIQLGGAVASSVIVKEAEYFSRLGGHKFDISSTIWNGGSALCDVVIAVAMIYYLSKRVSGGLNSTQLLLRRLITRIFGAGVVTAMIAVLNLVLTLLPGHPTYYQVPSALLAKTYSNSMMVLLNSRIKLGTMETLQSDDFNTPMHVQGITSTNPTNDYELRDKPTETIILTEGASRATSFQEMKDGKQGMWV